MSALLNGHSVSTGAVLSSLIEQMPVAMVLYRGPELRFEHINAAMLRIIGRRNDQVVGRPFLEVMPEVDGQPFVSQMRHVLATGEPFSDIEIPARMLGADGRMRTGYFNYSYTAVRDTEGGPVAGVLVMATEVTDDVEMRHVLKEKEEQLRLALEGGEMGTFDFFPKESKLLWSEKTCMLFGLSPVSGGIGYDTFLRGLHPDDRADTDAAVNAAMHTGHYDVEYRTVGIEDGITRWVRAMGKVAFDAVGEPQRFTGLVQDITARKEAEETDRYRQALLEAQNEANPDAILIVDTKGGMISFNRHFAEVWSIPKEIIDAKDDAAALRFAMTQLADPQAFIEGVNYCYAHPDEAHDHTEILFKDGRTIERWGNAVVGTDGKRYGWAWYFRDITERKQAERASMLKDRAVAASAEGVVITGAGVPGSGSADSPIVYANEAFERMTGYTSAEILGQDCRFLQANDHNQPELSHLRECLNGGRSCTVVLRNYKKDGTLFYNELTVSPVVDGGELVHFVGIQKDITARRQTEEALRQSEQRFRSIFNGQFLFLAILAPDGAVVDVNELPLQAAGIGREEVLGKKFWDTAWWRDLPDMRAGWPGRLEAAAIADGPVFSEDRFQTETGEVRVADAAVTAVRGADGAVEFFIVQASDVTERKKAEAALRESEDRYQSFVRQSSEGIWRFEMGQAVRVDLPVEEQLELVFEHAYLAECNDAMAQMYGFEKAEELYGRHIREFMPRDIESEAYLRHFIESGYRVSGAESKEIDRYGAVRYFTNNLVGIVEDGTVRRAWGTQRDITAQRDAQEALRESEHHLRDLTNTVPAIIWITDANGYCTYLNKHWYDRTGQSKEEAEGYGWLDATHPDDKEHTGKLFTEANEQHKNFSALYRLRAKDGTYRWAIDSGAPKFSADGAYEGMIGTVVDVHEQKVSEEALRESEQKFRSVIAAAPAGIGLFVGRDLIIESPNQTFIDIVGKGPDIVGKPLREAMPELITEGQPFLKILDDVFTTGVPFVSPGSLVKIVQNGVLNDNYYNITYTPLFNDAGAVYAILDIAIDVTDQIQAQKKLEESELFNRAVVEFSPVAKAVYEGPEFTIKMVNQRMLGLMGRETDIVGKNYLDVLSELRGTVTEERLRRVMETGETFHTDEERVEHIRHGEPYTGYYSFTFKPLRNTAGEVYGVMDTAVEVTANVQARKELEEQKAYLQNALDVGNLGTFRVDILAGTSTYTDNIREWFGLPAMNMPLEDVLGAIHPDDQPGVRDAILASTADETLASHDILYRTTDEAGITHHLRSIGKATFTDGRTEAVTGIIQDVTAQVEAQQRIEVGQRQILESFEQSPVAIALLDGDDLTFSMVNPFYAALVGRRREGLVGKPLLTALPELAGQGFDDLLRGVIATGEAYISYETPVELERGHGLETVYVDLHYQPRRAADGRIIGVLAIATDTTPGVLARRVVEESEQNLRSLVESAPFPIGVYVGREMRIQFANRAIVQTWGKGDDIIGKTYRDVLPELAGTGIYEQLEDVYDTGKPYHAKNQRVDLLVDGELRPQFFNYSFTPVFDAGGKVYGVMNTAANVTDIALARQRAEDAEARLRGAVELADLATWEVDATTGSGVCSERLLAWIGAKEDEDPLAAFMDAVHPDDRPRVAESLRRALELYADGYYDEEYRLINRLTGRQRIIHAQGRTTADAMGRALRVSGTAQDVTKERALQAELERQVQERTAELAAAARDLTRSNEELSQYAYVASHDLQEPLRKIQMFSGILDKQGEVSESIKTLVGRISNAAERMSTLIQSLLEFSRLQKGDGALMRPVDLSAVVRDVVQDFELLIAERGATVHLGELPIIEGVGLQMNQLFYNLVGNALKFVRPDAAPDVHIAARVVSAEEAALHLDGPATAAQYHHITVMDNGIGFEVRYAEQIFEVFKRLHGRDAYPGSGIGLALCRRIVANHGGALYAESELGKGSTFNILLPETRLDT